MFSMGIQRVINMNFLKLRLKLLEGLKREKIMYN